MKQRIPTFDGFLYESTSRTRSYEKRIADYKIEPIDAEGNEIPNIDEVKSEIDKKLKKLVEKLRKVNPQQSTITVYSFGTFVLKIAGKTYHPIFTIAPSKPGDVDKGSVFCAIAADDTIINIKLFAQDKSPMEIISAAKIDVLSDKKSFPGGLAGFKGVPGGAKFEYLDNEVNVLDFVTKKNPGIPDDRELTISPGLEIQIRTKSGVQTRIIKDSEITSKNELILFFEGGSLKKFEVDDQFIIPEKPGDRRKTVGKIYKIGTRKNSKNPKKIVKFIKVKATSKL